MAKRRTKAQIAAERELAERDRVVLWANNFGAPIRILEGWDPDSGDWTGGSPVGVMLQSIAKHGDHVTMAAKLVGISGIVELRSRGQEYLSEAAENREYIPIDMRPFIDLAVQIDKAEAIVHSNWAKSVAEGAKADPRLALAALGRRFPALWREQQSILTTSEFDEHDLAVTKLLADPDKALALAEMAHDIEDEAAKQSATAD